MNPVKPVKVLLAVLLSAPLIWLGWKLVLEIQIPTSGLGPDPIEAVVRYLGEWSIRMVLLAFSVTPVRQVFTKFGVSAIALSLARSRRLVGLFAFAYVSLHFLAYAGLYVQFEGAALWADFAERPYITAGLAAFLGLLALALTSTRGWQRRLGAAWKTLHKLIYPAVGLSLIHFWWLIKDGYGELFVYVLWFVVLLAARYWPRPQPVVN